MATKTLDTRQSRTILRIDSILQAHHSLSEFRTGLEITVEGPRIIVRGHLPTVDLRQELIPAIRQAGILSQVCNCVEVG